ncbi:MAG: FecR domain-containing protein, partial [Chloroflexi bacterium]|nr:FecR domain-containing protein [Chloroflexota bacterium]
MRKHLAEALNDCIEEIGKGQSPEACLEKYPHLRKELEPLLCSAQSIAALPEVKPSDEFIEASKERLMSRIRQETATNYVAEEAQKLSFGQALLLAWQRIITALTRTKRVAVPIPIALAIVLVVSLIGGVGLPSQREVLASQATMSILSGEVEVFDSGSVTSKPGRDGMVVAAGMRIKTGPASHAVLTFFEGSTITLEPDTEVEIKQIQSTQETTSILLGQWAGRTWSRVVKLADPGSRYQIDTPTATAIVRGTLFATEVEKTGRTNVSTTEGLVSVVAQGKEVFVPADHETRVEARAEPTPPSKRANPENAIAIKVEGPVVASVRDPSGASTGILSDGYFFSQIINSRFALFSSGTQSLFLDRPVSGEYVIALRYLSHGVANIEIQSQKEGNPSLTHIGNWGAYKDYGWLIRLNLVVKDGEIQRMDISQSEPLEGKVPEKLVTPALEGKRTAAQMAAVPDAKTGSASLTGKESDGKATGGSNVADGNKGAGQGSNAKDSDKTQGGGAGVNQSPGKEPGPAKDDSKAPGPPSGPPAGGTDSKGGASSGKGDDSKAPGPPGGPPAGGADSKGGGSSGKGDDSKAPGPPGGPPAGGADSKGGGSSGKG